MTVIISQMTLREVVELVLKEEGEVVVAEVVGEEEDIKMIGRINNLSPNKVGRILLHLIQIRLLILHLQILVLHLQILQAVVIQPS